MSLTKRDQDGQQEAELKKTFKKFVKLFVRLLMFFFFMGVFESSRFLLTPSLTLTALKMQFVRRLRMLRRTLYVASWQVYMGDGSNALIVIKDISKTLY